MSLQSPSGAFSAVPEGTRFLFFWLTHGLRCWLHSAAASRLEWGGRLTVCLKAYPDTNLCCVKRENNVKGSGQECPLHTVKVRSNIKVKCQYCRRS